MVRAKKVPGVAAVGPVPNIAHGPSSKVLPKPMFWYSSAPNAARNSSVCGALKVGAALAC